MAVKHRSKPGVSVDGVPSAQPQRLALSAGTAAVRSDLFASLNAIRENHSPVSESASRITLSDSAVSTDQDDET